MPFREKDEQTQESDDQEDNYKKLFPKIGRDFVSREDMANFIESLAQLIPGFNASVGDSKAVSLATEYKKQLDGDIKNKEYKDLIELEEKEDKDKQKEKDEQEKEKGLLD